MATEEDYLRFNEENKRKGTPFRIRNIRVETTKFLILIIFFSLLSVILFYFIYEEKFKSDVDVDCSGYVCNQTAICSNFSIPECPENPCICDVECNFPDGLDIDVTLKNSS